MPRGRKSTAAAHVPRAEARIVIGLDFGTTYSGVAYCDEKGAAEGTSGVQLITSWPGLAAHTATNEKVPSRIAYGTPPEPDIIWGNQIKHNTKASINSCMKLKLDERPAHIRHFLEVLTRGMAGMDVKDEDESSNEPLDHPSKTPVDMVADYLTKVREIAWDVLEQQYGKVLFSSMKKELVVTVPAVWSERAKDLTLRAVNRAEFNASRISLVSEPEAAAIYTLKDMREGPSRDDIKVGDVFILCDAGGGTVDLISYKITQIEPALRVEEAAVGSGDKCGASYVETEFLSWLEKWIGSEAFQKIPEEKKRHGSQMMTSFETNKLHFSGDDDEIEIRIPAETGIQNSEELNIDDRILTLSTAQMKQLFDPCVSSTIKLIDGQATAVMKAGLGKPKMVLVVGGFGRNEYLYRKIKEYCSSIGTEIRRPRFPWSAVSRGAVCRGLEPASGGLVAVRLARKFYGTPVSTIFLPSVHKPEDMYIDGYTGCRMAKGQMRWLSEKGDRLPEAHPRKIEIQVSFSFRPEEPRQVGVTLVGFSEDKAPERLVDSGVQPICRILADLSTIPLSQCDQMLNPLTGMVFYSVDLALQATFSREVLTWKVLHGGKEYGSATATYDD
ncbi:hypothetical protein TWF703_008847 [Orbilia oligospora]|uniref:Actin-like ATPase domain-containing protein n=1 Tax=Orbilia oligospora TaxID=2813651 RepID=A0A7C8JPA4_ORBOL|nr:hypothetical protein TWF703_008847 [Orbilia oligospora]